MSEAVYIDGVLKELGDRLFYEPVRPMRAKRTVTGTFQISALKTKYRFAPIERTRSTLSRLVRRVPEVMVKISGSGRGMTRIKSHLDYISRNGLVALEDQYGERIEGRPAVKDLLNEWRYGGFPVPEESSKREAFNIVLSMPPGTDRESVTNAARDFAREEFSENHSYVFATHTDEKHPHVHLCVKAMGRDGTRLNPRKADLQVWREIFAEKLRDHGIEANATRRPARGKTIKAVKQQGLHIQKRGTRTRNQEGQLQAVKDEIKNGTEQSNPWAFRIEKSRRHVVKHYKAVSLVLSRSNNPEDKALAQEISDFVGNFDPQETLREKIRRLFKEERERERSELNLEVDKSSKSQER